MAVGSPVLQGGLWMRMVASKSNIKRDIVGRARRGATDAAIHGNAQAQQAGELAHAISQTSEEENEVNAAHCENRK